MNPNYNQAQFFKLPLPPEKLRPLIAAIVRHNVAKVSEILNNNKFIANFSDDLSLDAYQALAPKYGELFSKPAQLALKLAYTQEVSSTNQDYEDRLKIAKEVITALGANEIKELRSLSNKIDADSQGTGASAFVEHALNTPPPQGSQFTV